VQVQDSTAAPNSRAATTRLCSGIRQRGALFHLIYCWARACTSKPTLDLAVGTLRRAFRTRVVCRQFEPKFQVTQSPYTYRRPYEPAPMASTRYDSWLLPQSPKLVSGTDNSGTAQLLLNGPAKLKSAIAGEKTQINGCCRGEADQVAESILQEQIEGRSAYMIAFRSPILRVRPARAITSLLQTDAARWNRRTTPGQHIFL